MNIQLEYTQPALIKGKTQNIIMHTVVCHDTNTHPNGQPIAEGTDTKWNSIIENLNGAGVGAIYDLGANGAYERVV